MWLIRTQTGNPEPTTAHQTGSSAALANPALARSGPDVDQVAARAYRESLEVGSALSERTLANQFGRSRRWARKVIAITRESSSPGHERTEEPAA